jgi:hypothetical protein
MEYIGLLSWKIKLRIWTVDRINSGFCLMVGFNFKVNEVADSVNRELPKFVSRLFGKRVL